VGVDGPDWLAEEGLVVVEACVEVRDESVVMFEPNTKIDKCVIRTGLDAGCGRTWSGRCSSGRRFPSRHGNEQRR
jgi:hypothetical protein